MPKFCVLRERLALHVPESGSGHCHHLTSSYVSFEYCSKPGVHNTRPAGRMRPAKLPRAARRAVPAFPSIRTREEIGH